LTRLRSDQMADDKTNRAGADRKRVDVSQEPWLSLPGLLFKARSQPMPDDKVNRGSADRTRIDVSQDYECRHWAEKFGVSPAELKRAVQKVGPIADDVARALGKAA
jgi:hypothetical protein